MADARERIRMSENEVWDFLSERRNLQVATLNRDGSVHLTTLWFALDGKSIVFDTYAKSQKAVNLARDPRITVLAEAGSDYAELRGVSMRGTAEVVADAAKSCELKVHIARRYDPDASEEALAEQARRTRGKRIVVRVTPRRIASWDHRKL
jgi:PPOX class probable F420-dependent enzyme